MTSLYIPTLCLMVFGMALSDQENVKFRIHVQEKAARFDQHIETNLYKNHVYYHNEKHNDVQESRKIQDFNKGIEAFCVPEKRTCYVAPLNSTIYPDATRTLLSMSTMLKNDDNSISDTSSSSLIHRWYIHDYYDYQTAYISQEMKTMLHAFDYPVYELRKVPDDAEILQGELPTDIPNQRQKRQHAPCSDLLPADKRCANNGTPRSRFGYTGTKNCDYLFFCDGDSSLSGEQYKITLANCGKTHMQAFTFYTCLCCPEQHHVHDCLFCNKVGVEVCPAGK